MEVSSFVLLYFGTKIFVRCWEVSVVQMCPLMEVPLYQGSPNTTFGVLIVDFFLFNHIMNGNSSFTCYPSDLFIFRGTI